MRMQAGDDCVGRVDDNDDSADDDDDDDDLDYDDDDSHDDDDDHHDDDDDGDDDDDDDDDDLDSGQRAQHVGIQLSDADDLGAVAPPIRWTRKARQKQAD